MCASCHAESQRLKGQRLEQRIGIGVLVKKNLVLLRLHELTELTREIIIQKSFSRINFTVDGDFALRCYGVSSDEPLTASVAHKIPSKL